MPRYTAAQFIKAIKGSAAIITTIKNRVGCDWYTAKKWIEEHPTVQRAYIAEAETVTDMAESNLFKAMKAGDLSALKFYLATKGKDRGYVQKSEIAMTVPEEDLDNAIERGLAKLASTRKDGAPGATGNEGGS